MSNWSIKESRQLNCRVWGSGGILLDKLSRLAWATSFMGSECRQRRWSLATEPQRWTVRTLRHHVAWHAILTSIKLFSNPRCRSAINICGQGSWRKLDTFLYFSSSSSLFLELELVARAAEILWGREVEVLSSQLCIVKDYTETDVHKFLPITTCTTVT